MYFSYFYSIFIFVDDEDGVDDDANVQLYLSKG